MSDHSDGSARRPLWELFSEPATDAPVPQTNGARRLVVERAPFLEPHATDTPAGPEVPAVPGARRRLGPGGLAAGAPDSRG
ncbi:hypothetical protein ACIF6L_31485 [Kitasatospora sp. NPDC086009]|uniref:hypothetical protein n=1 Tax=unclassified Kitasatospora TaxID=2633591 RepID=UPI0037C562F9